MESTRVSPGEERMCVCVGGGAVEDRPSLKHSSADMARPPHTREPDVRLHLLSSVDPDPKTFRNSHISENTAHQPAMFIKEGFFLG